MKTPDSSRRSAFVSPRPNRREAIATGLAAIWALPALADEPYVKVRDLWAERGEFSDLARNLNGKLISVRGYMAPPLKPEVDFFVLTKIPMAFCPFCDNSVSWPDDLMLVKMSGAITVVQFNTLIVSRGILDLGAETDPATGFVSRVRLIDAGYHVA